MSSELDSWFCALNVSVAEPLRGPGLPHLAVRRRVEAVGPAVPVVPVEAPPRGEEGVLGAGVCHVPRQHVDVVCVFLGPGRVQVTNRSRRQDVVAVVEVVVVVIRVSKVDAGVSRHVARRRHGPAPGRFAAVSLRHWPLVPGRHSLSYVSGNFCLLAANVPKAALSCLSPVCASAPSPTILSTTYSNVANLASACRRQSVVRSAPAGAASPCR